MYSDEDKRISALVAHVEGLSEEQISVLSVDQLSEICSQLGFLAEECDRALAGLNRDEGVPGGDPEVELGED